MEHLNKNQLRDRIMQFDRNGSVFSESFMSLLSRYEFFPGFADVHVHLREPGFSYKETIESGTKAAARGGFTDVCAMPNLLPVPDSAANMRVQNEIIQRSAVIGVHPYAAITVGERGETLADMQALSGMCVAFSDDGKGVQDAGIMAEAMQEAKRLGKIIAAHCEDNSLLKGGYIHDGEYARKNGHMGICSESEWRQVERDVNLAAKNGCAYHVCHVSAKESVRIIRDAKRSGVDVSAETAPHYLVLNDMMLQENGRFKMNPPVRSEEDRLALIEGLIDGTIDMIATDHAPHSEEEKSRGLKGSLMGVVGLETAFPVLLTHLVGTGVITQDLLIDKMCFSPRRRFGLGTGDSFSVWDTSREYTVRPDEFLSNGRATPFAGDKVLGKCLLTVAHGRIVWQDRETMGGIGHNE